jgi:hypothetical protein
MSPFSQPVLTAPVLKGANLISVFALVWWLVGLGPAPLAVFFPLLALGVVVTGVVFRQVRRRFQAGIDPGGPTPGELRRYGVIVVTEVVAIAVVVFGALALDRSDLIPSLVVIVVGVHFLPLATLYRHPPYRLLAIVMTAVGVVSLALVLGGLLGDDAGLLVPAVGAALCLWGTALRDVFAPAPAAR